MTIFRNLATTACIGLAGFNAEAQVNPINNYGRNIISVSPVQLTEHTPTGVGIQYERFVGASGKFSLYLPVAYSFGHSSPCDPEIKARIFYAYPGMKFYPAGYKHKVTYSVGPSLAFGKGTTNCNCDMDGVDVTMEVKPKVYKPLSEIGVLLNNSLNVQATEHVFLGGEVGIGATYLNQLGGKEMGNDLMLQMNLRVGYRF